MAAMTYFNRLRTAITNNPGTGDFSIGSALPDYKTLLAADNGKTLDILIQEGSSWEIRKNCTFTFATLTLTRGTLVDSSTGGAISFTSAATLSNVILAERVVPFENDQIITATGSVGAPSYSFTGLTNQGVTSYSSDTIALCNSGQISLLLNGPTNIVNYPKISASVTGNPVKIEANGADANINLVNITKGAGEHQFATNASSSNVQFKVNHVVNAVNYINVVGSITGSGPTISVSGSDTNVPLTLYSKGTGVLNLSTGSEANKQFSIAHTASAVNYVEITGGATSGAVALSAKGSDSNVTLYIKTKGTGAQYFATNDSTSNKQLAITNTASAVNYASITGAATGAGPTISVTGSDSNIDLRLTPKGTGSIRTPSLSIGSVTAANFYTGTVIGNTSLKFAIKGDFLTEGNWFCDKTGNLMFWMDKRNATISTSGSITNPNNVLRPGDTFANLTNVTLPIVIEITNFSQTSDSNTVGQRAFIQAHGNMDATVTIEVLAQDGVTWKKLANNQSISLAAKEYYYAPIAVGDNTNGLVYPNDWPMKGLRLTIHTLSQATTYLRQFGIHRVSAGDISFMALGEPTFYGQQYAPDGTAALPSYTFTSDTDTGIYRSGGNIVDIAAGGKQILSVVGGTTHVNYLKVQGNTTGNAPIISSQGTDTDIGLNIQTKGTGTIGFFSDGGTTARQFNIGRTASAVNYLQIVGAVASSSPILSAQGSDSNIDVVLTPKGTGRIRENTKYVKSYSQDDAWMDVLPMFVKDDGVNGFSFGQIGATGRFALFCAGSGAAKTIYCLYHMPHDLKLSQTSSYFHLHWEPPNTNAGDIIVIASIQAALRDGTWSSFYDHTFTLTPSNETANEHVVTELQLDTNLNSYLEPDAMFFVKISRDPSAVADTYGDQFYFHQADFHTQTDARNTTSKDKSTGWVKI